MEIDVKSLLPNPFRHLERYAIRREKVEALKGSIQSTEFWDNLVARKVNGKYELAYGHHRLTALKELSVRTINIPIRDLSDELMLKIMCHENMDEYGASALVEQETVRAVVEAFAEGKIELPKVGSNGNGRTHVAPSFVLPESKISREILDSKGYTAETVARFLGWDGKAKVKFGGWTPQKVGKVLTALSEIESGLIKQDMLKDLTPRQAEETVRQVRRVFIDSNDKELAVKVGDTLATEFRPAEESGRAHGRSKSDKRKVSIHTSKDRADELVLEFGARESVKRATTKKAKAKLEKENDQVKKFLDWLKGLSTQMRTYVSTDSGVKLAVSKFAPEAKTFSVRKIDKLIAQLNKIREKLQ